MSKTISLLVLLFSSLLGFSQETVVGKKIKSIEVAVVGDPKIDPHEGNYFRLKFTTTLENGDIVRGNDLAYESQDKHDFVVEIDGANTIGRRGYVNKGILTTRWECKKCEEGSENTIIVKVKREEDSDWLTSQTINIICDKTPEEIEAELNAKELIFSDADIKKVQDEFKTLSIEQIHDIVKGFHKLNTIQKKTVGIGFKGLDEATQKDIAFHLDVADLTQPKLDLQYWKNAPEVEIIDPKENIYTFKSSDPLDFSTGPSKNIAMLKEGNRFIQVKTYSTDTPDEYGFVKQYGFTVNVYDVSTGEFVKTITKSVEAKMIESSGISINQFKSCPAGYILVNPDMFIIFDKQFKVLAMKNNTSKLKERLYMDVDQLGTTNNFVVFFGDPNHTENSSTNSYYIDHEILDLDEGKVVATAGPGGIVDRIEKSSDCIETPSFSRVFSTSNNEYVFVYFDAGYTTIKKYRFENKKRQYIWNVRFIGQFSGIRRVEGNKFRFYTDQNESRRYLSSDFKVFTIDFSSNVSDGYEVMSTLKEKTTATNFISGAQCDYVYPQSDGSTVLLSTTSTRSEFKRMPIIEVYNSDFSLKGQFRVGLPLDAEAVDHGYFLRTGSIVPNNYRESYSGIDDDPYFKVPEHKCSGRTWRSEGKEFQFNTVENRDITGVNYKNDPDILTNGVAFFKGHTAFEFIREGDILYMMTPYAIVKLDMNHVVDAVPYTGPKSYDSSSKVFSRSYYFKENE